MQEKVSKIRTEKKEKTKNTLHKKKKNCLSVEVDCKVCKKKKKKKAKKKKRKKVQQFKKNSREITILFWGGVVGTKTGTGKTPILQLGKKEKDSS